jgi:hypothetical protein
MCVDFARSMMLGGVVVGMRVDERSPHSSGLDRERQREGENLPHDVPIVRDCSYGVK